MVLFVYDQNRGGLLNMTPSQRNKALANLLVNNEVIQLSSNFEISK